MAAKGSIAKQVVVEKLQKAFGNDFIGEYSGKYYVWVEENGQKIQIAVALTCPKTQVGSVDVASVFSDGFDFENTEPAVVAPATFTPATITEEEKANLETMMERLGL